MPSVEDRVAALEVKVMSLEELTRQLSLQHGTIIARIDQHEDDENGFHQIVKDKLHDTNQGMLQNAERLESMEQKMTGLLDAWETIIGTGKGLTALGKALKWLVVTGGALGAIIYFIQHFEMPK